MPGQKARYIVLYEDMLSKFDILIEGHQGLREQFERMEKKFDERINTTNAILEGVAFTLSDKIMKVEKKVDTLDQKVDALDQRVENVEIELKSMRKELGGKIDEISQKLEDHEIRITTLEYAA